MRKTFFVLILTALLSACATPVDQAHVNRMNSFVGKTEREVIFALGVPDKTYTYDDRTKVLTYSHARQVYMERSVPSVSACTGGVWPSIGASACTGGYPVEGVVYACDLSFNVKNGRVQNWFQHGNDCPRIR